MSWQELFRIIAELWLFATLWVIYMLGICYLSAWIYEKVIGQYAKTIKSK